MSFEHVVTLITVICGIIGLAFVGVQIRDANRQRKSDALNKIIDVNRQLLSLTFSHPELRPVLEDKKADPFWERRYLQLWLTHFSRLHAFLANSMFKGDQRESLERDVAGFMKMHNMQRHWKSYAQLYPASFQVYVSNIVKKHEPPKTAHAEPDAHQAPRT